MVTQSANDQGGRRIRRFFSPDKILRAGQRIVLSPEESHHLWDTLRLRGHDFCLLMDAAGREARSKILVKNSLGQVEVEIVEIESEKVCPQTIETVFYIAIPQKGKMDWIIEKTQELGADAVCPMMTDRCVVKIAPDKKESVSKRWEKIAREAAKQSGAKPLKVLPIEKFSRVITVKDQAEKVLFHPGESRLSFREWFEHLKNTIKQRQPAELNQPMRVKFFFGPEGGFSEAEAAGAKEAGAQLVSLGRNILKVETAAVSVLGVMALLGRESANEKS